MPFRSDLNDDVYYGADINQYKLDNIEKIFIHPDYKKFPDKSYIALVKLSSKVYPDDKYIATACIPTKPFSYQKNIIENMKFTGVIYG